MRRPILTAASAILFVVATASAAYYSGASGNAAAIQKAKKSSTPVLTLAASSPTVVTGGSITLSWTSVNTKSCTATGNWSGPKGLSGSETISNLTTAQTFSLSCSGKKGTASRSVTVDIASLPPTVQPAVAALNVLGVGRSGVASRIEASDPNGLGLTYSLKTAPAVGSATIDASTGEFRYELAGHTTATSDSFAVAVSNGSSSASAVVSITLRNDPLLSHQWHLQNTGQDAFASVRPVAGYDINVAGAWAAGFTGKGIKVAVVDSGLDSSHEDLADQLDLANSSNFVTGGNDPSRSPSDPGSDHGTSVAGIIAAKAFNGVGGRGVAYDSRLRGYNLLAASQAFLVSNMAAALGGSALSADTDVFNASFGRVAPALETFSGVYQQIAITTMGLRGGLGAPIANAAGNDFENWSYYPDLDLCSYANKYKVSCGDPAVDQRRGGYTPIIVGALAANGTHASYSSTGSSLWISAPGGEYGLNSAYATGPNYGPAIITTSRTGCSNYTGSMNPLDAMGANSLAANCQYTAMMNGTSSATPNVAGVIALMLEANPKLSVRDVKHILAKTAKKTDPGFAGVQVSDVIPGATVTLEQGWTTNAAGWSFSNRYGFGAVQASAAVDMARSYTNYLPPIQNSVGRYEFLAAPPALIAQYSPVGNYLTFEVSEAFSTVESVIVFLNIASTPDIRCNQVELKSPSGTKSILMHAANGFSNVSVVDARVLTNAFYGEPVNGTWTMTFYDFCTPSAIRTRLSTVAPQRMLIVGH